VFDNLRAALEADGAGVEVRGLFREDALIEVEAVAVIAPTATSGR
jgi:enamine deaminase RidA (YjgF/YER057c/UK114 family)